MVNEALIKAREANRRSYYKHREKRLASQRALYSRKREDLRKKARKQTKEYNTQWIIWFEKIGMQPICQICGNSLGWFTGKVGTSVHFDHRNGSGEPINGPNHFLRTHPCTEENQQKWLSFDLGVLCLKCNRCLPTKNRDAWLKKVMAYHLREDSHERRSK